MDEKQETDKQNGFDTEKIRSQLKRWQEKLLDTSRSNPLLGLNRTRTAKLKIVNPPAIDIFQKLVLEETELRLPLVKKIKIPRPVNDLFHPIESKEEEKEIYEVEEGDLKVEVGSPVDLRRKLRRIYDNSHSTIEERGVVTLYITFGIISWNDDVLGDSLSPILLVPCELISKGPNAALRLRMTDDEIQVNPVIAYYFREKHKINIPELPAELSQDSLAILFDKIREIISEQKWEVSEEVWLGTFSFESLVLYQDLKLLADRACSNPLIAAFSQASKVNDGISEALGDDLDSLATPEVVPLSALPVDSSQLKALTYAASGKHLVIHGPPGTGKSQTISNIIADALGRNKKVLFVSAKMAALNVVFDRLKGEGLGEFCLEAHGVKAGKLKIIEDLKRTLESEDSNNIGPLEKELENLQHTKEKLNEYVTVLHNVVSPLDLSVFQAIGRFTKLRRLPEIQCPLPWGNVLEVSRNSLDTCMDALSGLAQMCNLFDARESNPWRGFVSLDFSLQLKEKVESDLKFLIQVFTDTSDILKRLNKLLPIQNFTFTDLSKLSPALELVSKIKRLPDNWWGLEVNEISNKNLIYEEAALISNEYVEKRIIFRQFSGLSYGETISLLDEINTLYKNWYKRLTPSYFKWRKTIQKNLKPNTKVGYNNIQGYYALSKRLLDIEEWFEKKRPVLGKELATKHIDDKEAFSDVVNQWRAATIIRRSLPKYIRLDSSVTDVDPEISNSAAALVSIINNNQEQIFRLAEGINNLWPVGFVDECDVLQLPLTKFLQRADEVINNLNGFRDWVLLQRAIKHCNDIGLKPFLGSTKEFSSSLLPSIFEKRFLTLWIDSVISTTQCLAEFSSLKQQELIGKLRILDERLRRLVKLYIKASASTTSKKVKSAQYGLGNGGEVGILRFELQKKKRIKPLRKLFGDIPHVLQALKPCMLMSPVSVSTFLKPDAFHFDLIIFDEASQLPTPEAVPSILRGDQVIVAGDPNQLPPTSFFNTSLIGEDDEDFENEASQDSLESLLNDCVASVPVFQETYLKWHYRSRDERLINFSNYYFYNNSLITFPSVSTSTSSRGVSLEYVSDGIWDRGKSRTNRREARKAAQLAIEHFKKNPEKSLGIVALNTYQREAIEDAISEELLGCPELLPFFDSSRKDHFFIKSLESVQGDERDVILISVGYGKSTDGTLSLNFGPLNMDGGWRRLNVLVTRAKWQIILLTSLRSVDLSRVNPQNRGAVALKNFIEYAEREGVLPPDPAKVTGGETNDFEDDVREVLVERGFIVDAQVGAGCFRIDLAVRDSKDPSRYLIGIECDGATYHSSKVARDRDLLREEVLRGMGWRLHRVWSTEWFQNRNVAIKLMIDSVVRASATDPDKNTVSASAPIDDKYCFKPASAPKIPRKYNEGIQYSKYKKRFNRDILIHGQYVYRLKDILVELIDHEGPIHEGLLNERIKEVFNVQKIGTNISSNIEKAIKSATKNNLIECKRPFIWSKDKQPTTFRLPSSDVKRPLCYISPQELAVIILYIVEDQFGIMRDELPHAVMRILGFSRIESLESDRIKEVTDELIEGEQLVVNGIRVNLA